MTKEEIGIKGTICSLWEILHLVYKSKEKNLKGEIKKMHEELVE